MMLDLAFYVIAAITAVSALFVVLSKDLVHAVLWLGLSLLATAILYAILGAPFLAGVQVLTYVGGIVTLMIFGVMLTRRHQGAGIEAESRGAVGAAIAAAVFFAAVGSAIWKTDLSALQPAAPAKVEDLAALLLGRYLMAFEVASLLLLGATVGAVVIARRKDPIPGRPAIEVGTTGPASIAAREVAP